MKKELCNTADRKLKSVCFRYLHIMEMFLFCPHTNIYRPRHTSNTESLKALHRSPSCLRYITAHGFKKQKADFCLFLLVCIFMWRPFCSRQISLRTKKKSLTFHQDTNRMNLYTSILGRPNLSKYSCMFVLSQRTASSGRVNKDLMRWSSAKCVHVWWIHVLWHWWWPLKSHLEQTVDNGSHRLHDHHKEDAQMAKLHPNQSSDRWQNTGIKKMVSCSTKDTPMAHLGDPWITDHLIFRMTALMGDKLAQTADWTMKRTHKL